MGGRAAPASYRVDLFNRHEIEVEPERPRAHHSYCLRTPQLGVGAVPDDMYALTVRQPLRGEWFGGLRVHHGNDVGYRRHDASMPAGQQNFILYLEREFRLACGRAAQEHLGPVPAVARFAAYIDDAPREQTPGKALRGWNIEEGEQICDGIHLPLASGANPAADLEGLPQRAENRGLLNLFPRHRVEGTHEPATHPHAGCAYDVLRRAIVHGEDVRHVACIIRYHTRRRPAAVNRKRRHFYVRYGSAAAVAVNNRQIRCHPCSQRHDGVEPADLRAHYGVDRPAVEFLALSEQTPQRSLRHQIFLDHCRRPDAGNGKHQCVVVELLGADDQRVLSSPQLTNDDQRPDSRVATASAAEKHRTTSHVTHVSFGFHSVHFSSQLRLAPRPPAPAPVPGWCAYASGAAPTLPR